MWALKDGVVRSVSSEQWETLEGLRERVPGPGQPPEKISLFPVVPHIWPLLSGGATPSQAVLSVSLLLLNWGTFRKASRSSQGPPSAFFPSLLAVCWVSGEILETKTEPSSV